MTTRSQKEIHKSSASKKEGQRQNNDQKIIYTSRTHSQLAQCSKELKMTSYNKTKAITIGSRNQLCIHEEILGKKGTGAEKVHLCRAYVKAKKCRYYSGVEKALKSIQVTSQPIMDIEDLIKAGRSCMACPYYMAKQLVAEADVVFMPYNYLLDQSLLKSLSDLTLEGAIVIFDEAHNVEKICQDAASAFITSSEIIACNDEIDHVISMLRTPDQLFSTDPDKTASAKFSPDDCLKLKQILASLDSAILDIKHVSLRGRTMPGGTIFDILAGCSITLDTYQQIVVLIENMLSYLTESLVNNNTSSTSCCGVNLIKVNELLETVFVTMTVNEVDKWKDLIVHAYQLHIELEEPQEPGNTFPGTRTNTKSIDEVTSIGKPKKLNYWCFNPAFGMAKIVKQHVHSIILTSGTLTPLQPYINELDLKVTNKLENPHIVDKTNVFAQIIGKGPDGTLLNGCYDNRHSAQYVLSLGSTIRTIANFTPNGMLVFFTSYAQMDFCIDYWKACEMWSSINRIKTVFIEPRCGNQEFDMCMTKYSEAAHSQRGALFLAILRGKVSEGLDFKDKNGRTVLVAGIPFPPYHDPQVILKMKYLDSTRTVINQLPSGETWYKTEATRAVNQAIGRVIRHKNDYGAIFLCDHRFTSHQRGLSRWVQPHLKVTNAPFSFQPVIKNIGIFFASHGQPRILPSLFETSSSTSSPEIAGLRAAETSNRPTELVRINNPPHLYIASRSPTTDKTRLISTVSNKSYKIKLTLIWNFYIIFLVENSPSTGTLL